MIMKKEALAETLITEIAEKMIESVVTGITNTIEGPIAIVINLNVIQGMIEIVTETEEETEIEIMTKEIEMKGEGETDLPEDVGHVLLIVEKEKEIALLTGNIKLLVLVIKGFFKESNI